MTKQIIGRGHESEGLHILDPTLPKQLELISIRYVRTREQSGDVFTKALSGDRVSYLYNKLGLINIYAPT